MEKEDSKGKGVVVEWKVWLENELERDEKATVYSLATAETETIDILDETTGRKTGVTRTSVKPRVRHVVHRSFLPTFGSKAHSVVLQTTTDIRSAKIHQLFSSTSEGHDPIEEGQQTQTSEKRDGNLRKGKGMERGEGRGYGDEKDPNENANAINENEKDRRRRHHKEHDDQDQDLLVRQSTNNTNTASSSSSRRSSPASTRLLAPSLAPMAPTAEIAWYFPTSRIQFRLLAKVYVLASPSFSMEDKEEGNEQHHHHHRSLGGLFPVDLAGEPPTENMRVGETQKEKESENEEDENEEDEKGKGKEPDDGDGDGAKNKHGGANVGESDRAKANRKGGDAMNRRRTMERRKRTRRMKEWEMVRVRAFDTLSPALRASFARPYIPGSVLSNPEEAKEWPTELGPISDQPQEQEQENHDHDHDQDQEKERMEKIDGREEREEEEEAMRGIGEKVGREGVPSASVRPTVSASASASASASPGEAEKMKKRALENFAVVYLDVEEVDVVDLGKIPNERYRYRKVVEAEERVVGWKKDVLVP